MKWTKSLKDIALHKTKIKETDIFSSTVFFEKIECAKISQWQNECLFNKYSA